VGELVVIAAAFLPAIESSAGFTSLPASGFSRILPPAEATRALIHTM
jgi:hypothetical protein